MKQKPFTKKCLLATLSALAPFIATAQWATSGGNIYNTNAGNTGIGTTTPGHKLHVVGDTYLDGTTTVNANFILYGGINWQNTGVMNCYGNKTIGLNGNTWSFWNGKVGIGTTSPTEQLEVGGNISLTAAASRRIYMGGQAGGTFGLAYNSGNPDFGIFYTEGSPDVVRISPNGSTTNGNMNIYGDNRVGIGTNAPENSEGWNTATDIQGAQNAKLLVSTATGSVYSGLWSHNAGIYGAPAGGITGTWSNHPFSVITNKAARVTVTAGGNVGIGTTTPGSLLDVNGQAQMTSGNVGTTLTVGTALNVGTSAQVGTTLQVGTQATIGSVPAGTCPNAALNAGTSSSPAIYAYSSDATVGLATLSAGQHTGLVGTGGYLPTGQLPGCPIGYSMNVGVEGDAYGTFYTDATGIAGYSSGGHYSIGASGSALNGTTANYGVLGVAPSGGTSSNWAGYFVGNVYSTTSTYASDRKLKNNIKPLAGAMDMIMALKPSSYTFKTEAYKQMNLPQGEHMGLIAQELEQVLPNLVHNNIQPEMKDKNGRVVSEEVAFKCVNYNELIPVLIAAVQEQQSAIKTRDEEIQTLKNEIATIKSAISQLTTGTSAPIKTTDGQNRLEQTVPNPTDSKAQVTYHLAGNVTKAAIVLYTMDGTEVKRYAVTPQATGSITIDAVALQSGTYVYSLITNDGIADTKKMIIAR